MNDLIPRSPVLRSPRWWWRAVAIGVVACVASLASYAIGLTDLMISPMLLTPGIGTALLVGLGRSYWPAFLVGDVVGEIIIREGAWSLLLLSAVVHVLIVLVGTTWMQRVGVGVKSLGQVFTYAAITLALSVVASLLTLAVVISHGGVPANDHQPILFGWLLLGYLGGYLVAGGLVLAWAAPSGVVRGELANPRAMAGLVAVSACAVLGLGAGIPLLLPVGLLGALAMAARGGPRWGSLAMATITATAIVASTRGAAPFGGIAEGEQSANTMLAIVLFTMTAMLLGGYRASPDGARRSPTVIALLFAAFMAISGIAAIAVNQVSIAHNTPFVTSGLLLLGAALGLVMVRLARTPPRPTTRRGLILAAIAGVIYVANLAVFLQAVPLIGGAGSTALSMTAPLAVVVLAVIVERTRPTPGVIVAVALIVAGAVFYASGMTWNASGVAMALGSAWIFAASLIVMHRALEHSNVTDVALISSLAAAVVALPVGLIVEGASAFVYTAPEIGALALGALGAQLIPQLSRSWALDQIGSSPVGAIGVIGPVVTIVLSMWLLSNPVDTGEVGGLILIAGGGVLAAVAGARRGPRPSPGISSRAQDGAEHGVRSR